ncbi:unnamed protein product [Adineta ricciae]|uniref:Uncharacterized protein n=1 Tax=Adineta ricciae TaxID=249248 RepID=A0A815VEX8_ADIRI|nr:unnamed protein product [Adineta ricciae]CAF1527313.1 unnamed protein product [Adineta ricciae]
MPALIVPPDIEEARKNISDPIPATEPISNLKPNVIVDIKQADIELDGSIISPFNAMRRIINAEDNKSTQLNTNGKPTFTPLQRAFQRKSSNKLARLAALCEAISYAIKLCSECINIVRFGDGLYLKEHIDDVQINWLMKFHDNVKLLIERDIAMAPKFGTDQRPLIVVEKPAVHASNILYQYASSTITALFDGTEMNINEATNNNGNPIDSISPNGAFYEHQAILLKMTSPILVRAWFNNEITGLPFTKTFNNYRKSKGKLPKLNQAISELVQNGILKKGIQNTRHIVGARKETYLKTSPATIRSNIDMLNYLASIDIDIDTYEHVYLSSPLPMIMELTTFATNAILFNDDYIEYCHLFNDARIEKEMEERLSKHMVESRMLFGRKQYYIPLLSQIAEQDNLNIGNNQQDDDAGHTPTNNDDNNNDSDDINTRNNNDPLSTFVFEPHRPVNNSTPNTISSFSESSSASSEMLNKNTTTAPQYNNYIHRTTESDDHLPNEFLSSVDDMMNKLINVLDYNPTDTNQSGSTPNQMENIFDNPTSPYRNESNGNTHRQNQNRSVLVTMELSNNNNINGGILLPMESTSTDMSTSLENMNSQQTLELLSGLLRNKKHLLKRILDEDKDDINLKRARNNENEEIASPFVNMNLSESLSSTSAQTQSNKAPGANQIIDEDLNEAYQKIILNDTVVMSRSDICNKLKHIKNISKLRDNIISNLVADGLLIKGDWFGSKNVNGSIELLPGFLKAFPKNQAQGQVDFARLLAKYKVHYSDYEQSFKKNKTDTFPRTLTAADVKHKTWLFSNVFVDVIEKNGFLSERLVLDPSAIVQENNTPLMHTKRDRKPKKVYSPSDNKK